MRSTTGFTYAGAREQPSSAHSTIAHATHVARLRIPGMAASVVLRDGEFDEVALCQRICRVIDDPVVRTQTMVNLELVAQIHGDMDIPQLDLVVLSQYRDLRTGSPEQK